LSVEHSKQILYNINRGVLRTNDKDGFTSLMKAVQPITPIPLEQIPLQTKGVVQKTQALVKDPIKENLKPLKALLRQNVSTVKKEVAVMSIGQIRKLLELEKETKNRKSVVNCLISKLEEHEIGVLNSVGVEDSLPVKEDLLKRDPMRSTQITDVVESEEETVVLNPRDFRKVEEVQSKTLLGVQEVLFSIDEE
jgi:hypothetical protein